MPVGAWNAILTRARLLRVLSVRVPKGEEQDRLKVMAEYDRMPDGFMILGKKGGRLTLLALNGLVLHSGQHGWRDGQEAMYEVKGG